MSTLSAWVLSIAGVVLLSVLVELILPSGVMNKYIKGIFAFIIMLVILTPIPKLLNQHINISNFFNSEIIKPDEDYLEQINLDKLSTLQTEIENEIKQKGYKSVKVYISSNIFDNSFKIKNATVDISNLVITSNAEHTNILKIKQQITEIVKNNFPLGEDHIFYEE